MFERAVAAAYIHIHADTAPDFVDYDFVRRWKIAQAIEKTFGISAENADKMAELGASFQSVRARFEVTDCKTCNTKRLNHTWSKLDLVAMAGRVGAMGSLVVPAYYLPLAHAHSTLASISARLEEKNGVLTVRDSPDYREVDRTFQFSHVILLKVLKTQVEHFGLQDFEEAVNAALEDYERIWFKQDLDEPG